MEQDGSEDRRAAAAAMGRARTPAKAAAARENGKRGGRPAGTPNSEAGRAAQAEGQRQRRAREREERQAAGSPPTSEDGENGPAQKR